MKAGVLFGGSESLISQLGEGTLGVFVCCNRREIP